jgi:RHS repeat-associated protein
MRKSSSNTLFFYQNGKLVTVKQGNQQRAILRHAEMPLAEVQAGEAYGTGLLVTDDKGSVLAVQADDDEEEHDFSAYGHDPGLPSSLTLLGFNGQLIMPAHAYLLGNGYRAYSPTLHRFLSPDSWSPFGPAGVNAYCYCEGDPINSSDPTGHMKRQSPRLPLPTRRPRPTPTRTLADINEPDVFSRIITHLDLPSVAALSRTNKHIHSMTEPALKKIKSSLAQPDAESLIESALNRTLGPNLGHSRELLVKRPDIELTRFARRDAAAANLVDDINIERRFRSAQRTRSPSRDSSLSGSDSEDEMQRINDGIRRALNGPQL